MRETVKNILFQVLILGFLVPTSLLHAGTVDEGFIDRSQKPRFYNGRVIISKNFNYEKKNIAVSYEWGASFNQIYYQQCISQELMANDYSVIERVQFAKVLAELSLDQTGAVKSKEPQVNETASKDSEKAELGTREYTRNELKKLGELLGISYLATFAIAPKERGVFKNSDWLYMRFIDLQTAEVVATVSLEADRSNIDDVVIARSIVKAILASQKVKASVKEVFINFFGLSENYEDFLKRVGASQILYYEAFPKNYTIIYIR